MYDTLLRMMPLEQPFGLRMRQIARAHLHIGHANGGWNCCNADTKHMMGGYLYSREHL
jgi:hypothetical protein